MTPMTPAEAREWADKRERALAHGVIVLEATVKQAVAIARAHADALERLAEVERERDEQRDRARRTSRDNFVLTERINVAEAEAARLREALAFYADPSKKKDADGWPVQVPDFYDELDFGERARAALSPVAVADPREAAHEHRWVRRYSKAIGAWRYVCVCGEIEADTGEAEPMASETKAACGNCRYRHDLGDRRVCRRYPPDWPAIADSWWCGEFQPKAKEEDG